MDESVEFWHPQQVNAADDFAIIDSMEVDEAQEAATTAAGSGAGAKPQQKSKKKRFGFLSTMANAVANVAKGRSRKH